MARRQTQKAAASDGYHCSDCANAYEPHEKDCHGQFFLTKCKYRRWSQFLDQPACQLFEKRNTDGQH